MYICAECNGDTVNDNLETCVVCNGLGKVPIMDKSFLEIQIHNLADVVKFVRDAIRAGLNFDPYIYGEDYVYLNYKQRVFTRLEAEQYNEIMNKCRAYPTVDLDEIGLKYMSEIILQQ